MTHQSVMEPLGFSPYVVPAQRRTAAFEPARLPVVEPQRFTVAATGQLQLQLLGYYLSRRSLGGCVASTNDLDDVVATCRITEPDIVLLCGFASEAERVVSIVRELSQLQSSVKVIVLALGPTSFLSTALTAGARGYVTGATTLEALDRAIDAVATGRTSIDPVAVSSVVRSITSQSVHYQLHAVGMLTPRELDVLRLLADGASTEVMASRLGVSVHTTRTHVKNVMRKLDARTRLQAAALGVQRGLIC